MPLKEQVSYSEAQRVHASVVAGAVGVVVAGTVGVVVVGAVGVVVVGVVGVVGVVLDAGGVVTTVESGVVAGGVLVLVELSLSCAFGAALSAEDGALSLALELAAGAAEATAVSVVCTVSLPLDSADGASEAVPPEPPPHAASRTAAQAHVSADMEKRWKFSVCKVVPFSEVGSQ